MSILTGHTSVHDPQRDEWKGSSRYLRMSKPGSRIMTMTLPGVAGLTAGGMGSLVRERWSGRRVASCEFTVPEKLLPPGLHRLSRSTKAGESRAMRTGRGDRHHTDERAGGADWTPPAPGSKRAPQPSTPRGAWASRPRSA